MWTALSLVGGFILLVAGAELLVRGASRLAVGFGISPLVVGLTVVAFGTSAPELAVSVSSALRDNAGIAVGNIVGSNIFNVLFILGVSALITPLVVSQRIVRVEVPLMIGASLLVLMCGLDGYVSRVEGTSMFVGLIAYTIWCIIQSRSETTDVRQEYASEFGGQAAVSDERNGSVSQLQALPATVSITDDSNTQRLANEHADRPRYALLVHIVFVICGLGMLVFGSDLLVAGATELARWLGASDLLIGLTIVAAGTSLPEVATSIMAAIRGERDIAVGNVVGSNLFNILGVLGLSAVVARDGVPVPQAAMLCDIPVMLVTAVACLPVFFTGHKIARWEGGLFLIYYLIYVTILAMNALDHVALRPVWSITAFVLIPLTAITLAIGCYRWERKRRAISLIRS